MIIGMSRPKSTSKYPELNDEAWLRARYEDEGLTRKQVGELLGCSATAVLTAMRRHGIKSRSAGRAKIFQELESRDWLVDHYVERFKTSDQIADELGCSSALVLAALRKHGIKTRQGRYAQLQDTATLKLEDAGWLREHHVDKQMSATEMGKIIGCTNTTVRNALLRHGIPVRGKAETTRIRSERMMNNPLAARRLRDGDWLRMMYAERQVSTTQIAKLLGISEKAVNGALVREGIPRRSLVQATHLTFGLTEETSRRLEDPDWLREAYVTQQRSLAHIGDELGVTGATVRGALTRHGFQIRRGRDAMRVHGRAVINGYDAQRRDRLATIAKDAGEVGKAYTQVIRILGKLDKVPYTGRENSRLEGEAMAALHKAEVALAERLTLGS